MIKKLFIILFVTVLLASCGKKGDPTFKEEKQNSKIFNLQLNIVV